MLNMHKGKIFEFVQHKIFRYTSWKMSLDCISLCATPWRLGELLTPLPTIQCTVTEGVLHNSILQSSSYHPQL